MIKKYKLKGQYLIASCLLAIILCSFKENFMANVKAVAGEVVAAADDPTPTPTESTIDVTCSSTTVKQNMLNTDSAVITDTRVLSAVGNNQSLTVSYTKTGLPTENKVIAVLLEPASGGVVESKFLDANKSVKFENIPDYIKRPQIHLYKQSPDDPEYLLRKENFIAKHSYLMPYVPKITNNGDLTMFTIPATNGEGVAYEATSVPASTLYTTTVFNIYSLMLPANFMTSLSSAGVDAAANLKNEDVFAVVIAQDEEGNEIGRQSVVSTVYSNPDETTTNFCRFEFILPYGAKQAQIHLYKNELKGPNFLCKFLCNIQKTPAINYSL